MTAKKAGAAGAGSRSASRTSGKSQSSRTWLERQLNDPYVARAKREGFRSRAAFKLIEIDDKHHLLKPGARVVDLGAAPGGWSQVAASASARAAASSRIDVLDMDEIPGVEFAQIDFLDPAAPDRLKAMLGGPADVVLSDMAANATGHRPTDHLKIMALVEAAARVRRRGAQARRRVPRQGDPGRHREPRCSRPSSAISRRVKHVKPAASRSELRGALCAGDRISRLTLTAALATSEPRRHRPPGWRTEHFSTTPS